LCEGALTKFFEKARQFYKILESGNTQKGLILFKIFSSTINHNLLAKNNGNSSRTNSKEAANRA
jgi:hypothetical protein